MKRLIAQLLLFSFAIALPVSVAHGQRAAAQPSETLIKNATVLTITRGTLHEHRRA